MGKQVPTVTENPEKKEKRNEAWGLDYERMERDKGRENENKGEKAMEKKENRTMKGLWSDKNKTVDRRQKE